MINEGGSGLNETAFILTKFSQVSVLGLLLSQLTCSMPNGIIWILTCKIKIQLTAITFTSDVRRTNSIPYVKISFQ